MKYKEKVVIITGGANGIGNALVQYFLQEGAYVACVDKEAMSMQERFFFMQKDISKKEEIECFMEACIKKFKQIDIIVNNACYSNGGLHTPCSYEMFNEVLQVGVSAPYYITSLALPYFRKGGSIVNISSTRAMQSQSNWESYSATKGAINALTHAMSVSLRGKVRVNAVSPGWIDTTNSTFANEDKKQHTVERVGEPNDIVGAVAYLCSEEASFINGQNITVDGGMSVQMIYHNDEGWYNNK